MSIKRIAFIILAVALVVQPVIALGNSNLRIIPIKDAVATFADKENVQFVSEAPLPQGQVIRCKGNCLVQGNGFQLVGHDGAVFSVSESAQGWSLFIQSGSVDFAAKAENQPVEFRSANNSAQVQKVVFPSGDGMVRGTASVAEAKLQVAVTDGELELRADNGVQKIAAGQSAIVSEGKVALMTASAAGATAGAAAAAGGSGITATTAAVPLVAAGGIAAAAGAVGLGGTDNDRIQIQQKPVSPY
ncbi:MAG: hypothetical protein WAW37_14425 [Syntrophobacteraceae bacterium]